MFQIYLSALCQNLTERGLCSSRQCGHHEDNGSGAQPRAEAPQLHDQHRQIGRQRQKGQSSRTCFRRDADAFLIPVGQSCLLHHKCCLFLEPFAPKLKLIQDISIDIDPCEYLHCTSDTCVDCSSCRETEKRPQYLKMHKTNESSCVYSASFEKVFGWSPGKKN